MLMYEHYRGHAGDTGGYGVSIYDTATDQDFVDVGGGTTLQKIDIIYQ